jgi:hypothetical protein
MERPDVGAIALREAAEMGTVDPGRIAVKARLLGSHRRQCDSVEGDRLLGRGVADGGRRLPRPRIAQHRYGASSRQDAL